MEKEIINLTPHKVMFMPDGENCVKTFPPSEKTARVGVQFVDDSAIKIDGIEYLIKTPIFGRILNPPPSSGNNYYIVSRMVANALKKEGKDTSNLLIPSGLVRDKQQNVIGCSFFESCI